MGSFIFGIVGWLRENVLLTLALVIVCLFLVVGCQHMRIRFLKWRIQKVRVVKPDRKVFPIFRDDGTVENCGCAGGDECTCVLCTCEKCGCENCPGVSCCP